MDITQNEKCKLVYTCIMTPLSVSFLPWPALQLYNIIGYLYALSDCIIFFENCMYSYFVHIHFKKEESDIIGFNG